MSVTVEILGAQDGDTMATTMIHIGMIVSSQKLEIITSGACYTSQEVLSHTHTHTHMLKAYKCVCVFISVSVATAFSLLIGHVRIEALIMKEML